jgi:hypothetical protein
MWDMNSQRTGLRVASLIFVLFAIGHAVRLFKHAKVMVGTHDIPMGVSWVGLIIAALLCIWMWRLSSAR